MLKILIVGIITIALFGCTSIPKEVDVPIIIKQPPAKIPSKPMLPIANLNKNSKSNDVIKAYVASVEKLQGYCDQLIRILKAY